MARWLLAVVILLLVGLGYGLMTGQSRIDDVAENIEANLDAAGHDWADVDMSGNVATLSGIAPDAASRQAAIRIAEDARCTGCKESQKWHDVVSDDLDVAAVAETPVATAAVQSPYIFSARKTSDDRVVLDGFLPNQAALDDILRDAADVFGSENVLDNGIALARGAPDDRWVDIIQAYFRRLARLDEGRLLLENFEGSLQGVTSDADVQSDLYAAMEDTPGRYNFAGNVTVPGQANRVIGQSQSQTICQGLMDDLRRGRKVFFDQDEALIEGEDNFDLLSRMAGAANQCPSFRIAINGYTSSEGEPAYNQQLSERRANAVLTYLNEQADIDRSRLSAQGFGEDNPIASNDTTEGRERNRRIEFILSRAG